eukprot:5288335-Amphidinium_carterae.1
MQKQETSHEWKQRVTVQVLRRFPKFVLLLDAFHVAAEALPVLADDNVPSMQWSMWFTIVTMTTLGYGDTTPESGAQLGL